MVKEEMFPQGEAQLDKKIEVFMSCPVRQPTLAFLLALLSNNNPSMLSNKWATKVPEWSRVCVNPSTAPISISISIPRPTTHVPCNEPGP